MTAAAPAASPAPPQVLLAHHLRQLKLPRRTGADKVFNTSSVQFKNVRFRCPSFDNRLDV